jgi:hypothetical protein
VDVGLWTEREGGWLGREREREGLSFPQFQFLYHNFLTYLHLFCGTEILLCISINFFNFPTRFDFFN